MRGKVYFGPWLKSVLSWLQGRSGLVDGPGQGKLFPVAGRNQNIKEELVIKYTLLEQSQSDPTSCQHIRLQNSSMNRSTDEYSIPRPHHLPDIWDFGGLFLLLLFWRSHSLPCAYQAWASELNPNLGDILDLNHYTDILIIFRLHQSKINTPPLHCEVPNEVQDSLLFFFLFEVLHVRKKVHESKVELWYILFQIRTSG